MDGRRATVQLYSFRKVSYYAVSMLIHILQIACQILKL